MCDYLAFSLRVRLCLCVWLSLSPSVCVCVRDYLCMREWVTISVCVRGREGGGLLEFAVFSD